MKGMNEVPSVEANMPPPPTHTVAIEGPFGSVYWTVASEVYDALPRQKRDGILDATGRKVLQPFFERAATKMLEHVGAQFVQLQSLNTDSSLESLQKECRFGLVIWTFGQGLWDQLPVDQRPALLEMMEVFVHDQMEAVAERLFAYGMQTLQP